MNTYSIEIKETLSKLLEIEAPNEEAALLKIKELYQQQEIVLSAEDMVTVDFLKVEEGVICFFWGVINIYNATFFKY